MSRVRQPIGKNYKRDVILVLHKKGAQFKDGILEDKEIYHVHTGGAPLRSSVAALFMLFMK